MLEIEVAILPGKGEVQLTGRLGDWLKESARTALSFIRSRAAEFGLAEDFHQQCDLHVHYPGNALKTDGPSAGMAMTIAMISALTSTPVRADIAMTGEISLRGRILPIGGVKEKLLAAHRRGMTMALLPKNNEKDLQQLPTIVTDSMQIKVVEHVEEALQHVFQCIPRKSSHSLEKGGEKEAKILDDSQTTG